MKKILLRKERRWTTLIKRICVILKYSVLPIFTAMKQKLSTKIKRNLNNAIKQEVYKTIWREEPPKGKKKVNRKKDTLSMLLGG